MSLKISGLNELRERLERLRPEEVMAKALAEQAARMAARVRDGLSEQPGAAGHQEPWLQSGALRDSVGAQADGLQAAVGSSDPAAVPQELGTSRMPARPFLAPVAAGMGEEVARAVAAAVVAALRGDSPDAGSARVDLCGDGPDGSEPLGGGAIAGGGAPTSTSSANAPGAGGHARPAAHRSNTDGFDPSGVRLASEPSSAGSSGQQPAPIEPGTETPSSAAPGSQASTPSRGRVGRLTGSLDDLPPSEKSFVLEQLNLGHDVEVINTGPDRTPDFKIGDVQVELKTFSGGGSQTSDALSKKLSSRIMDGRGQASNIVVDARSEPGMTREIAERGIARAYGADDAVADARGSTGKIQSITVRTPGGDVTIARNPLLSKPPSSPSRTPSPPTPTPPPEAPEVPEIPNLPGPRFPFFPEA